MKLENLYETKPMQKLQEWGGRLQASPAFSAISSGMMATIGLILAGSIFTILATILNLVGLVEATDALYEWLTLPYNMTMGIMAVATSFCVAYAYSNNLGIKGALANGIVSMVMFLMVNAPMETVTLADGSTMSVLDTTYMGGSGLFTALIMPIIVVRIIKLCQEKHITLTMPDSVPQFLSDSFASLVPLVINIVLWCGLNTICETLIGANISGTIVGLLSIPLSALVSVPGMFVLAFICMLLWSFGIHGTSVVFIVLYAPMVTAYTTNAELVAAGQDPVFSAVFLFNAWACCGGTGNVLPLAVCCLRAKSEQLKSIGKAGLVPAIFNISEPMAFGVPIMYNPIIAIPFILNVLITMAIVLVGYLVGFFQPPYIFLLTTLPIFMGSFLNSMAWQNLFITVIAFVVGYLVYAPFVKMYDKQCLEQEQAMAADDTETETEAKIEAEQ